MYSLIRVFSGAELMPIAEASVPADDVKLIASIYDGTHYEVLETVKEN